MLRFLPDGWLEGLLRPFLLADPATGLYLELAAPDWRFALLITFLAVALLGRRGRLDLGWAQQIALLSLLAVFYIWTFAIGNGRYFLGGLLLVGPLLMVAWRRLPGTLAMRVLTLAGVVWMQAYTLQLHYNPNAWGLLPWRDGPGLAIEASPLREQPAVFLTITGISYSILVPRFHPQSRWANIAGQRALTAASPEYPRPQALLQSPLPKYLVVPANPKFLSASAQPLDPVRDLFVQALAAHGLALSGAACTVLHSDLSLGGRSSPSGPNPQQGFWFCPVQAATAALRHDEGVNSEARRLHDVFERLEQRCPRFFPPGGGVEDSADGLTLRHYAAADTRIYIDSQGQVLYKYFRSINPTLVGTVDDVRQDHFTITCDKLPGRYQLPWQRD